MRRTGASGRRPRGRVRLAGGGDDAFLEDAIDWEEFNRRIESGTRFLENVVTMSDFPVEKIEEKVRELRKIGLGIMGLAQLYIQLGVRYGSDEGNEIAQQLMTHINHGSKRASHELAEERGPFEAWEDSKYANPTEYREWFETTPASTRRTGKTATPSATTTRRPSPRRDHVDGVEHHRRL